MSELTLRNRQRIHPLNLRLFRQIAESFLREQLGTRSYEISISIVGAAEMTALNENHLHHAGSTDVITFGYGDLQSQDPLIGDIFICIDDAMKQAREFKTSWQSEMVRYFVHGVLHLQGYDDLAPAKRRMMKREENRLLKQLDARFRLSRIHAVKRGSACVSHAGFGVSPNNRLTRARWPIRDTPTISRRDAD